MTWLSWLAGLAIIAGIAAAIAIPTSVAIPLSFIGGTGPTGPTGFTGFTGPVFVEVPPPATVPPGFQPGFQPPVGGGAAGGPVGGQGGFQGGFQGGAPFTNRRDYSPYEHIKRTADAFDHSILEERCVFVCVPPVRELTITYSTCI